MKALRRIGFEIISQKGSHIKLRRNFDGKVYTVIVPNHKEVALGTLQSILKQAGIMMDELEENI
ncbi:MAG TPA: type II toxin-antitoxin system HicA family toxin [Patescibacteria group bacterium]